MERGRTPVGRPGRGGGLLDRARQDRTGSGDSTGEAEQGRVGRGGTGQGGERRDGEGGAGPGGEE